MSVRRWTCRVRGHNATYVRWFRTTFTHLSGRTCILDLLGSSRSVPMEHYSPKVGYLALSAPFGAASCLYGQWLGFYFT